jgi:hypothetical protein
VTACGSSGQSASTSKAASTGAAGRGRGIPDGGMVLGVLCVGMGVGVVF